MSDLLEDYQAKQIEWKVKIATELPLHYIKQEFVSLNNEYLFCLDIPFPLLQFWGNLLEGKATQVSYMDLLNATIVIKKQIYRRNLIQTIVG